MYGYLILVDINILKSTGVSLRISKPVGLPVDTVTGLSPPEYLQNFLYIKTVTQTSQAPPSSLASVIIKQLLTQIHLL